MFHQHTYMKFFQVFFKTTPFLPKWWLQCIFLWHQWRTQAKMHQSNCCWKNCCWNLKTLFFHAPQVGTVVKMEENVIHALFTWFFCGIRKTLVAFWLSVFTSTTFAVPKNKTIPKKQSPACKELKTPQSPSPCWQEKCFQNRHAH